MLQSGRRGAGSRLVYTAGISAPKGPSGGLRGLQTASENIRRVFMWSSAKNHTKKPVCGLRGLEAGSESIRRVSVRYSPKVIPRDRFLRAIAEILRKGLRGMRGWSERMSEFASQEVVG